MILVMIQVDGFQKLFEVYFVLPVPFFCLGEMIPNWTLCIPVFSGTGWLNHQQVRKPRSKGSNSEYRSRRTVCKGV